jgi:hypothetical protein
MKIKTSDVLSITIVFLLAGLIGLTIVKIVEVRMSDISINMPAIKFPQQNITVQVKEEDTESGAGERGGGTPSKVIYNSLETMRQGGGAGGEVAAPLTGEVCKKTLPPARTHYNSDNYHSESKEIVKPSIEVPKPSASPMHSSYPASYPREKMRLIEPSGSPSADGKTYYMDPKRMTPVQLVKFQQKAKFENMTVTDYQNWLRTFKNNPGQLTGYHRANLKVLVRGGQLEPIDMPQRHRVPDTSHDQYTKLLHGQVEDNIPQPEFLGYHPHNYEEHIGQAAVGKNRSLRHLDYVNPDEPLKTWALTRESEKLGSGDDDDSLE